MASDSDIAVIGMSCLFAGAGDVSAYWTNILDRKCFIEEASDDWAGPYYDPDSKEISRIYTRRAGLLGDLAEFDPVAFGVVPNAIDASEPDHFIALREAAGALWDAGYKDRQFDRERAGVILGRGASPNRGTASGFQVGMAVDQTVDIIRKIIPELTAQQIDALWHSLNDSVVKMNPESAPGQVSNVAVGRIANRLDLMGPSYMVDAACSSSLIAVEAAMRELLSGDSDLMLAGGVQGSMPPQVYMLFCQLGALARTKFMPFDEAADGVLLGEGCGFVLLKRLADAERDEDRIYAVLKGCGIASDGKALGLLAPRVEGEALAMRRAYEKAGIDPTSVSLIEAHGTGIPLGDQTELKAMASVFGERKRLLPHIAIGSVKSMIGHCIPAAGVASLIKTVLALYHKVLPPTLCDRVQPELGLDKLPFFVNQASKPWIHPVGETPRRAGINAFGFGGINVHLVAEEHTPPNLETYIQHEKRPFELCVFSAMAVDELEGQLQTVQQLLSDRPEISLEDLAAGLAESEPGNHRLAIVAENTEDLLKKLAEAIRAMHSRPSGFSMRSGVYFKAPQQRVEGQLAFLFPGQGSPYPYMVADLARFFPQFRAWYDEADTAYADIWPCWLSEYIFPPTHVSDAEREHLPSGFYQIDVAQEMVITTDLALNALLNEFGIYPDVVIGHSAGEYAALAASGAIAVESVREGREVRRAVNRLYREFGANDAVPRGALLMIGAMERELVARLVGQYAGSVHMAMDNCPHQQVLFGPPNEMAKLAPQLREHGGIVTELPYSYAYHTPLMKALDEKLMAFYSLVPLRAPQVSLFSCSSLSYFPDDAEAIRLLAAQQWWTPVQFRKAMLELHGQGVRRFIEVGPANLLTGFASDTLRGKDALTIPVNEKTRSGLDQLLRLLGQLFVDGSAINMEPLFRHRRVTPVDWHHPPEPSKRRSANRKLNLSLPTLSLDESSVSSLRSCLGSSPQPAGADPTDHILSGHFALMNQFLENQRLWAEAIFGQSAPDAAESRSNSTGGESS